MVNKKLTWYLCIKMISQQNGHIIAACVWKFFFFGSLSDPENVWHAAKHTWYITEFHYSSQRLSQETVIVWVKNKTMKKVQQIRSGVIILVTSI